MFQYKNAYYSIFFDLIVFTLEKVECGYSMDNLENSWIANFSIPHPVINNNYDEDLYENNYLGFLYYYELLNSIEEMVNKYYQDYHSTFYD